MNKNGTVMVEAAMVFPLIILAVISVIYILVYMYMSATSNAHVHMALREEAGIRTRTVLLVEGYNHLAPEDRFGRNAFRKIPEIYEDKALIGSMLFASETRMYQGKGLARGISRDDLYARTYLIDEAKYIRQIDFLKKAAGI